MIYIAETTAYGITLNLISTYKEDKINLFLSTESFDFVDRAAA